MRRRGERLAVAWTVFVVLLIYMPFVSVVLASLANTRYLRFPHRIWSLDAYRDALGQYPDLGPARRVSFKIAA